MTASQEFTLHIQEHFDSVDRKFTGDDATRALAEKLSEMSLDYAMTPGETVEISKQSLAEILWMLGQALSERETLETALFNFTENDVPGFIDLINSADEIVAGHYEKHRVREITLAVIAKYLLKETPSQSLKAKIQNASQKILGDFDDVLAEEEFTEERVAQLLSEAE